MSDEDVRSWIYAGGIPYQLTEGDIICAFSQYGEITEISLSRDKETGKSRGFCFLKYEDPRSCELAVDNFNGTVIVERKIKVSFANNVNALKSKRGALVAPTVESKLPIVAPYTDTHTSGREDKQDHRHRESSHERRHKHSDRRHKDSRSPPTRHRDSSSPRRRRSDSSSPRRRRRHRDDSLSPKRHKSSKRSHKDKRHRKESHRSKDSTRHKHRKHKHHNSRHKHK